MVRFSASVISVRVLSGMIRNLSGVAAPLEGYPRYLGPSYSPVSGTAALVRDAPLVGDITITTIVPSPVRPKNDEGWCSPVNGGRRAGHAHHGRLQRRSAAGTESA